MSNQRPLIQFKYKPETEEGQICDFFRNNYGNTSGILRSFIVHLSGYEYLLKSEASEQHIRQHCLTSIGYFHALAEMHKAYLYHQGIEPNSSNQTKPTQDSQ